MYQAPPARSPTGLVADSSSATVFGFVADTAGKAIAQAQVVLDDQPGRYGVPTDSLGAFVLRRVVPGTHRLVIRSVPHITDRREISVRGGELYQVQARLRVYACSSE